MARSGSRGPVVAALGALVLVTAGILLVGGDPGTAETSTGQPAEARSASAEAGPARAGAAAGGTADVDAEYPDDITPPPGTQYPCALTALPRELPGIPEADRGFINRTYARILRATQAKLVALKALDEGEDLLPSLENYDARLGDLVAGLGADTPPAGLEAFQADVVAALELQRRFFERAGSVRMSGGSMSDIYAAPEGRQASARLIAAWQKMQARYRSWDAATRDSVYHHLCALDLF